MAFKEDNSSSSIGWLGSFARRSLSGTMLSSAKATHVDDGLELVHMGQGYLAQDIASGGTSQPVAIPGSAADVSAPPAVLLHPMPDGSCSRPVSAPVPGLPGLLPSTVDRGSSDAPWAGGADEQQRLNPPLSPFKLVSSQLPYFVEHPLREQILQEASWASSGDGLPSALDTPCPTHMREMHNGASPQQEQQQQASHKQHLAAAPEPAGQPQRGRQRVRWLPNLKLYSDTPADNSSNGSHAAEPVDDSRQFPAVNSEAAGSSQSSRGSAEGPSPKPGLPSPASVVSSTSGSPKLPLSGSPQLDKYLKYLLGEAHPHSFMYYPGWGLSEEGCAAVGEFLRRDKRIKVMTLSGNQIRDEGCELLAEGLSANKMLSSLDLSNNKISDMGAIALAEALHSNRALKELQLSNNKIGDEGAEALAAAFAGNHTLKKLHLNGNPISAGQKQVVEHVLKSRVYKMPNKQPSDKKKSRSHLRKNSSLQFHIELTDSEEVLKAGARHRLPPATAIAALTEPADTLESSLATQVAHLMAELRASAGHMSDPNTSRHDDDPPSCSSAPQTEAAAYAADSNIFNTELVPLLALRLAWRGYEVVVRTSVPTADASNVDGFAAGPDGSVVGLKHTFVRAVQPGLEEDASPAVVIDPYFRDQFQIPHVTDRYSSVLGALPRVLVLAESRLYHLVEALSTEMAQAFRDSGLTFPPWRDVQVLLDKWLSTTPVDVAVDPDATLQSLKTAIASSNSKGVVSDQAV